MAEETRTQWSLQCSQYLGEISALCFLHFPTHLSSLPFLLAGSGSQLMLYELESGKMLRSFHVFDGIRVHGITCLFIDCAGGTASSKLGFQLAVFGERRVKLFSLVIELFLGTQNQSEVSVNLNLLHLLPKFGNWVLDVCFMKGFVSSYNEGSHCLAIGCSDNSVHVWDILNSSVILEVQSPERCLLYSMRLWGDNIEALRIASGTIFNELIVAAGEDCTCRMWGLDGKQLLMIKEHMYQTRLSLLTGLGGQSKRKRKKIRKEKKKETQRSRLKKC